MRNTKSHGCTPYFVLLLVVAHASITTAAPTANTGPTVVINHSRGAIPEPSGVIGLNENDTLTIRLIETYPTCFTYQEEAVLPKEPKALTPPPPAVGEVDFHIVHDGKAVGYRITATVDTTNAACLKLPAHNFDRTVLVKTYGWEIAATGAFTVDKLTDPVFSLEPGTKGSKTGFVIREDKAAQDKVRLGLGAMLHLSYNHPRLLCAAPQLVCWSPITFGIGIDNAAQTKYFFGTSGRFGTKLFLTLGYVLGPTKRLPNGLQTGSFTENANALTALPTRTSGAFFAALSYSFLDVGLTRFTSLFKEPAPAKAPQPTVKPKITLKPATGAAGSDTTVTLIEGSFTGDEKKDQIFIDGQQATPKPPAPKTGDKEATITIPRTAIGNVAVKVIIAGTESDPQTFEVK